METVEKRFGGKFRRSYVPHFNAAPSQDLPVVLNESPGDISFVRWGLARPWMRGFGLINVRTETLKEKDTFRDDLLNRRCLVLADGFYEWKEAARGRKVPFRFVRKDGALFAFAGLWEVNRSEKGQDFKAFSIITTAAEPPIAAIHARMPVILRRDEERLWLSQKVPLSGLWELMENSEARALRAYEVSRAVNNARNDSKELILPVDAREEVGV
jgi:putative SOS response-associated peptidase YedK